MKPQNGHLLFLILLSGLFFLLNYQTKASHSVGADLSWECLGGNEYRFILNFYRDCDGISAPYSPNLQLNSNSCNQSDNVTLSLDTSYEVSPICDAQQGNSTCNGGTFPGIERYVYSATYTLPDQCSDWRLSYDLCCRNSAITNLDNPGNQDFYIEAMLNNTGNLCDNSPVFTTLPVPYICANQQFNYNHGAIDADGDSLSYSLENPLDDPNNPIPYNAGYSPTDPMDVTGNFNFDQATGQMIFTPSNTQQPVVSVKVEEYRNGQLIGSTMRDIQVVVINNNNCNNQNPLISGINGTPGQNTDTFSTTSCANSQLCFNINATDPDNDNVTLTYNNGIPDATFTSNGPGQNVTATFCWTPSANDIGTHNFAVTVKDDACPIYATSTRNYSITVDSGKLSVTLDTVEVSCPGGSDGGASVAVSGGTGNYGFEWNTSPPVTDSILTGVEAGSYRVTVSDSSTCNIVGEVYVPEPSPIDLPMDSVPVSCFGQTDGKGFVGASGGNGGFSFQWNTNPQQTSDTASGLSTGTYTVTATDSLGCTAIDSVNVTEPPAISLTTDSTQVTCHDGSDGTATVTPSGGTGSFAYSWNTSPPQMDSTATGLTAGNYSVTVSDQNSCLDSATVQVTEPPPMTLAIDSLAVRCPGQDNGLAFVSSIGGGNGDYNYQWNTTPVQNDDTASGLDAGIYTVTVTDSLTCTAEDSIEVTEPPAISLTTDSSDVICNGQTNGSATVNATGGNGNFTYAWNTSPPQSSATASGLSAGTYKVTVTDNQNCQDSTVVQVNEPPQLTAVTDSIPVRCHNQNSGTARVIPNGGNGGYTYQWDDPSQQTSDTATNLIAGSYSVTVSDSLGCNVIKSVNLPEPAPLALPADTTPVTCHEESNGSASVTPTGGNGGYSYNWNTTPVQNTSTANGLSTGSYTVTVSDSKNCTDSTTVFVPEPSPLTLTLDSSRVSCNGGADGQASAYASGGNGSYTYEWGTSPTTYGSSLTNLFAGIYQVTVTDLKNCSITDSVTIEEPPELEVSTETTPTVCQGDQNGTISAVPTGGNGNYSYEWQTNPPQTDSVATGLGAGTYNVVVSDAEGCIASASGTITEPDRLVISTGKKEPSCFNSTDGKAWAEAEGGVGNYNYEWSIDGNNDASAISGRSAGLYSVTISDERGCTKTKSIVLNRPDPVNVSVDPEYAELYYGEDIRLQATPSANAERPVNYSWQPSDSLSCINCQTPITNPLDSTSYQVIMTDKRGCVDTATSKIAVNKYEKVLYTPNAFSPNQDEINDKFRLYAKGIDQYNLKVFNRWGELLFETDDITDGWDGTKNGKPLQPAVYVYSARLQYKDGSTETREGSVTLIR